MQIQIIHCFLYMRNSDTIKQVICFLRRLRILRYDGGGYFKPHRDGVFTRDNGERSQITVQIYLNEVGSLTRLVLKSKYSGLLIPLTFSNFYVTHYKAFASYYVSLSYLNICECSLRLVISTIRRCSCFDIFWHKSCANEYCQCMDRLLIAARLNDP